jgi:phosphatidylinositol-3-phosphatase
MRSLAAAGASFSDSHGVTHPSQPNYLALFSGSTHGVTSDTCPVNLGGRPNLGRQLVDAGLSFTGYSEGMPTAGFTGCGSGGYARKHNPWVDFSNLPGSSNQPFSAFPTDFGQLPTVSFVVPDLCNDMHDCPVATGDTWLRTHLGAYARWARTHDSLLIVTFDEDDFTASNQIPTFFSGPMFKPGTYSEPVTHYRLLRTLEAMYGLPPLGSAATTAPIGDIWKWPVWHGAVRSTAADRVSGGVGPARRCGPPASRAGWEPPCRARARARTDGASRAAAGRAGTGSWLVRSWLDSIGRCSSFEALARR